MQDRFHPSNKDLSMEVDRIDRKGEALLALKDRSVGNLLVADSEDGAKKALFEINFFSLATSMALQQLIRLEGKASIGRLTHDNFSRLNLIFMEQMDGIKETGWSDIKDMVGGAILDDYSLRLVLPNGLSDYQQSLELPRDFSYDGVPLLRKSRLIWPELQFDKFGKLVDRQLGLIRDGPDDWQYPDLPVLQRMVEEAGISELSDEGQGISPNP